MSSGTPIVLTVVDDPELSASSDRVAAAVGARAVPGIHPSARNWRAAEAVVLDAVAARRFAQVGMSRRPGVLVIASGQLSEPVWSAAIAIGAQHVCALPADEPDFVRHLADAIEGGSPGGTRGGPVVAVVPGPGGGGASVFAAALAQCAGEALLVDLDPYGGGIDLVLGGESAVGPRWPDLTLHGGRVGWVALRDALPRRHGVSFLSASRTFHDIDAAAAGAVLDAGRRSGTPVICDLPRQLTPAAVRALESAELVVVVTSCDVRGVAATAVVAGVIRTVNPNIGVVVRGPAPGGLAAAELAEVAAAPLLAVMRADPMLPVSLEGGGLRLRRRSPLGRAARTVLQLLECGEPGRAS